MRIRSIFRYPGSKSRLSICQSILSFFPLTIKEYREPFCGAGGIYFAQNLYEKRWVNDINSELMSVYLALRDYPEEFLSSCRDIPCVIESLDKESCADNLRFKFNEFLHDSPSALRYFFLSRGCWGGCVRKGLTYFTNPAGWNITRRNGYLERIADYIDGTRITSGDYSILLEEPGEGVFLYLDPVYYSDSERPRTSKLYDDTFIAEDHERLAEVVLNCVHTWCMSYDNHPEIRRLYSDFNIYELEWTYNISSDNRPKGKELIITNYIPDKVKTSGILNTN